MNQNLRKPAWLLLYTTVPLFFGLVWLDMQLRLPVWTHPAVEIGILVLTFGLMGLWVYLNENALWGEDMKRESRDDLRIIYYPPAQPQVVTPTENDSEWAERANSRDEFLWLPDEYIPPHAIKRPLRDYRAKASRSGMIRNTGKVRTK